MSLRLFVPLLCAIAAACASTPKGRRAACNLSASDSALAQGRPLYRDCSVDRQARRLSSGATSPDYRPPQTRGSACYSADLQFVVDSTGTPEPETTKVLRFNDSGFAEAVLAVVPSWRYEPAIRDGVRVRQIVTTHQSIAAVVVVVPAGSSPPAGRPRNLPQC